MYDTPRAALTDDELFERVAVKVLRTCFPELRITGPSGDLNRDTSVLGGAVSFFLVQCAAHAEPRVGG